MSDDEAGVSAEVDEAVLRLLALVVEGYRLGAGGRGETGVRGEGE